MAPKIHSNWLEHGWWIALDETRKPTLWITAFAIEEGRHWSALGSSYGIIVGIHGTADAGLTVSVNTGIEGLAKFKLKKVLMMAPIPHEFLAIDPPMHGLKAVDVFWKSMPEELKIPRETQVWKFKALSPPEAFKLRKLILERRAYEDMARKDPGVVQERLPPRDPEDVDEVYRLLAAPLNVNWVPVHERARKRVTPEAETVVHSNEGGVARGQRAHRQCRESSRTDAVVDILGENETLGYEEAFLPRIVPVMQPSVHSVIGEELMQPESTTFEAAMGEEPVAAHGTGFGGEVLAPTSITEVGAGSRPARVGSQRGGTGQPYNSRVRLAAVNAAGRGAATRRVAAVGSAGIPVVRSFEEVVERFPEEQHARPTTEAELQQHRSVRTRSAARRSRQRVAMRSPPTQGNDGEDADDDDDSSEGELQQRPNTVLVRSTTKSPVVFPTELEYKAGYVWGHDQFFHAKIDTIRNVVNAETNHRTLMEWRVNEMYERLKGLEADGVSPVTLRPIAYRREQMNEEREIEVVEVPFSSEGAAREFERAFLAHCPTDPFLSSSMLRTPWLQNNIIWEPVDGQHIVAACKRAQQENREGTLPDEMYRKHFAARKAKFVVYNNPQFYIEASVRINAREFDRAFFTTYYENLIKLRDIWKACGSPSVAARIDDAWRAKALTMAASALHWSQDLPKHMTLGELSKKMVDYTRHAWNEDEESYEAILQVCKDYEEGKLFFSKIAEDKWKKMAREKNLDATMDGNPKRKKMEKTWLRPLSRVSKENYLRIAKRMAAKGIVNGKRDPQEYYFNNAGTSNPLKGTVAYAVDRLQRKDAVRNQIRFLMVQAGDENPSSMDEFLAIDASKYGDAHGRQFTIMGKTLDTDTRTLWSSPTVKTVSGLKSFEPLIPAFVKQHFHDIKAGRKGYAGYDRDVEDVANARWDWQVALSEVQHQGSEEALHVRCRGGFFEDDYVELGKPCLWIFDCRRGGSEGEEKEWSNEDYSKVFQQLQKWMLYVLRWNVVFLFPPGVYFDEAMRTKLALPEGCQCLRGMWVFKPQTISTYVHDLRHGEQRQRGVQAVGDIAIIMQYPLECGPVENFPRITDDLVVVFGDSWSTEVMPRAEDKLERTPMELKKMVQMYLPRNWGLVTLGITLAVPGILETNFVGSEVIIMEGASSRTQFVYNMLQFMYGDKMVMVNSVDMSAERRPSQVLSRGDESPDGGPSQMDTSVPRGRSERVLQSSSDSAEGRGRFQVTQREKGKERAIDSGASSSSNEDSGPEQRHSDELRSGGQSLGSSDTNSVGGGRRGRTRSIDSEEDPDYIPLKVIDDVDNMEQDNIEANMEGIEDTPIPMQPTSALSAYSMLDSMSLTPNEDGYFYDRQHVRYLRTGEEGRYKYFPVSSILEGHTLSPALSEGVSTPVSNAMVDTALQYASSSPLSPMDGRSLHEDTDAVGGEEPEDLTQSSVRVLETPDETVAKEAE